MIRIAKMKKSFGYAVRGLRAVWRNEQNFRLQSIVAILVLIVAGILPVTRIEFLFLIAACGAVLILELLNTIFEHFTDFFSPRYSDAAHAVKDMMAGAVLLAAIAAIGIGGIVFFPHIAPLLSLLAMP